MKIKIKLARLSFPDLFEATQYQGQGPFNFGASFLGSDDDGAKVSLDEGKTWLPFKTGLEKALEEVARAQWAAKAGAHLAGIKGNSQKCCFVDGNTKAYDGYADKWALSAKRPQDKGRPLVIDEAKNPLVAADGKPYAGCYVNATVELWAQDNSYGKGIRATLVAVQFAKAGDAFGGGAAPSADDFDEISEGAGADALV
jgi:hypothetical protein